MHPCCEMKPPLTHVLNLLFFSPCLLQTSRKSVNFLHCDEDLEANIAVFCFSSPGEHRSPMGLLKCSQQLQSAAWGETLLDLSLGIVPSGTHWTGVTLALPPPSPSACSRGSRHCCGLGTACLLPSLPSWLLVLLLPLNVVPRGHFHSLNCCFSSGQRDKSSAWVDSPIPFLQKSSSEHKCTIAKSMKAFHRITET